MESGAFSQRGSEEPTKTVNVPLTDSTTNREKPLQRIGEKTGKSRFLKVR
jgi:hypothetical protein